MEIRFIQTMKKYANKVPKKIAIKKYSRDLTQSGYLLSTTQKNDSNPIDFKYPRRKYIKQNSKWNIYLEYAELDTVNKFTEKALVKLNTRLDEIFAVLPAATKNMLENANFYLFLGKNSPNGGRPTGMMYSPKGAPRNYADLDNKWSDAIIIYSAKNLVYLSNLWAKKALMHELAHAWHLKNWPSNYQTIVKPYLSAKRNGLYMNIQDNKKNTIDKAYALTNQKEYFAELSAIYFVDGDYYPFNKDGLRRYDNQGFKMIEELWGLNFSASL